MCNCNCSNPTISGLIDKVKPTVHNCPSDVFKFLLGGDLRTEVTWVEPSFTDNVGIVNVRQTHSPGNSLNLFLLNFCKLRLFQIDCKF